jgi:hypothetical protein
MLLGSVPLTCRVGMGMAEHGSRLVGVVSPPAPYKHRFVHEVDHQGNGDFRWSDEPGQEGLTGGKVVDSQGPLSVGWSSENSYSFVRLGTGYEYKHGRTVDIGVHSTAPRDAMDRATWGRVDTLARRGYTNS